MIKLPNTFIFILLILLVYSCSTKSNNDVTNEAIDTTSSEPQKADKNNLDSRETKNPSIIYIDSITNDAYGKRGVVFRSSNEGEQLFQVRVLSQDSSHTYIFMGAVIPKDSTDTLHFTRIYEYSEKNGIHVIDSMPIAAFSSNWVGNENEVYFDQLLLRNSDNLLLEKNKLLYFKENRAEKNKYENPQKKYYSYILNSKDTPIVITEKEYNKDNPKKRTNAIYHYLLSPEKKICLASDIYNIDFYNHLSSDSIKMFQHLDAEKISDHINSDSIKKDFSLLDYFPLQSSAEICDEDALFGTMEWHPEKDILFFDNSGYCYACIWMFDYKNRVSKKLVPEHEAIHPFFFKRKSEEFLAYVQTNEIRVYELSSFNEDFKHLSFRSPENQDDENRNTILLNNYKSILKDIDTIGILRADIKKAIVCGGDSEMETVLYSERDSSSNKITTLDENIVAGILDQDSVSDENGYKWYKILNPKDLTFGWVYGTKCFEFEFSDTNFVRPSAEEISPYIYFGKTSSNYQDPPDWNDMPINDYTSLEFIINMSNDKLIILYESTGGDWGQHSLEINGIGTVKNNHLYLNCIENVDGQDGGYSTRCKYDINLITGDIKENCEEPE